MSDTTSREQWERDPAVQCVLDMDRVDDWGAMNDAEVAEYEAKAERVRAVVRSAVNEALEAAAGHVEMRFVTGDGREAARVVRSHKIGDTDE